MAGDPLSFVYNGRDNTGAATILKQPTVAPAPKPDTRFLDSLGFDIRDGGNVWEYGKENVINARNEYTKAYTQALAEGIDLKKDPQRGMALIQKKQEVNDWVGKEKRDEQTATPIERDLAKNFELYAPDAKEKFEAWKRNPNRPPQPEGVVRYTKADFSDANKPTKKYYKVVRKVETNPDGSSTARQVPEFQEEEARKDFQIDYRQSQGNYKLEGLKKLTYEDLANRVPNWDQVPLADRGLMVEKVLEDDFIQKAKANMPTTIISNKDAPEDKTAQGSGGSGGITTTPKLDKTWATRDGKLLKRFDWILNPITGKNKDAEGKLLWNDGDEENATVYNSKLVQPRMWEDGKMDIVVTKETLGDNGRGGLIKIGEEQVSLPLSTNNKGLLVEFYNFDADKVIFDPNALWRKEINNFPTPPSKYKKEADKRTATPKAKTKIVNKVLSIPGVTPRNK
jgi:hypothetical protein